MEEDLIESYEEEHTRKKLKRTHTKKVTDDRMKNTTLSLRKPSYTLKGGTIGRSLRSEHQTRLWYLLRQLVRSQNWSEASGVLSVLLKGTRRDNSLLSNRRKYTATLELLEHMGVAKVKPRKIRQVYEIWNKKNFAVTKSRQSSLKDTYDVLLEFILYSVSKGNNDWAYVAVLSLLQQSNFSSDPKANLVAGLTFSHLWYNSIQKEVQLHYSISQSNSQSAYKVQDSGSHSQPDANTSIRFTKVTEPEEEYEHIYMNSDESDQSGNVLQFPYTGNKRFGSVFYARDLETFLMPFRYPSTITFEDFVALQRRIKNDHYKAAVKYLQNAVHSTPPAFEALLPLIQMLLLGDQVKEAIEEVESAVQSSEAALPFRLKASLLEHFSKEDVKKRCIYFEDILKKDPTCNHSMAKLINLHHDGHYSVEKLIEMLGLHLDATYADSHIWKEFASCFLKHPQCDEDKMSTCVNSSGESYTKRVKNVPDLFRDDLSRINWRLRCRWWLTRHFTKTRLASEVSSGSMELVAYKAASACHLYGPESTYIVKACEYLERDKSQEWLMLKMHMENAIGFYTLHNSVK